MKNQQDKERDPQSNESSSAFLGVWARLSIAVLLLIVAGVLLQVQWNKLFTDNSKTQFSATDVRNIQQANAEYFEKFDQYAIHPSILINRGMLAEKYGSVRGKEPYEYQRFNDKQDFCVGACISDKVPADNNNQCVRQLNLQCKHGSAFSLGPAN